MEGEQLGREKKDFNIFPFFNFFSPIFLRIKLVEQRVSHTDDQEIPTHS